MNNTMKNKIIWSINHDCAMNEAFLIGSYNSIRFTDTFKTNSWFSFGLMFAKWKITRRFKILFNDQHNEN